MRPAGEVRPASRPALVALTVLTGLNLLNYVDRYLVPPLVPDLKRAMDLTDGQVGWLWPAFMIVYTIAAPVFGALGDRSSRTRPMALGVLIWSVATMLSGFARNYPELFAARALVGIGEAAYIAIAPAILADYFPPQRRGQIYSILNMAIPVGAALGYILGGLIGHHVGWRAAFLLCGAPGVLLAAAVLKLHDPPRGAEEGLAGRAAPREPPLAVYVGLLGRAGYRTIVLGYAAYTFALGGLGFWMPVFLERARGVPAGLATTGFGALVVVTGLIGTLLGGWLGDRSVRRSAQGYLWFSGAVTLAAAPASLVALTAGTPIVYGPALVVAQLLLFASTGPINAAIANAVSPFERASALALAMLAIHLLGDIPSPPLIGHLSDAGSLQQAVLLVPVAVALAGVIWLLAAQRGKRAVDGA